MALLYLLEMLLMCKGVRSGVTERDTAGVVVMRRVVVPGEGEREEAGVAGGGDLPGRWFCLDLDLERPRGLPCMQAAARWPIFSHFVHLHDS